MGTITLVTTALWNAATSEDTQTKAKKKARSYAESKRDEYLGRLGGKVFDYAKAAARKVPVVGEYVPADPPPEEPAATKADLAAMTEKVVAELNTRKPEKAVVIQSVAQPSASQSIGGGGGGGGVSAPAEDVPWGLLLVGGILLALAQRR